MFANIGKIRKNHRLSRAVKGLWGPGANLPPALELLLCSVSLPDLCRSQCRALSLSRSWTLHTWAFKLLERLFLLWTGGRCSGTCAKTQMSCLLMRLAAWTSSHFTGRKDTRLKAAPGALLRHPANVPNTPASSASPQKEQFPFASPSWVLSAKQAPGLSAMFL